MSPDNRRKSYIQLSSGATRSEVPRKSTTEKRRDSHFRQQKDEETPNRTEVSLTGEPGPLPDRKVSTNSNNESGIVLEKKRRTLFDFAIGKSNNKEGPPLTPAQLVLVDDKGNPDKINRMRSFSVSDMKSKKSGNKLLDTISRIAARRDSLSPHDRQTAQIFTQALVNQLLLF